MKTCAKRVCILTLKNIKNRNNYTESGGGGVVSHLEEFSLRAGRGVKPPVLHLPLKEGYKNSTAPYPVDNDRQFLIADFIRFKYTCELIHCSLFPHSIIMEPRVSLTIQRVADVLSGCVRQRGLSWSRPASEFDKLPVASSLA